MGCEEMKTKLSVVLKVLVIVGIIVFVYALGYNVGQDNVSYDYSDSILTIDELTIENGGVTVILKGFKSVADGRCMQELLKLLAEMEIR